MKFARIRQLLSRKLHSMFRSKSDKLPNRATVRAALKILDGTSRPGQVLELDAPRMFMGRDPACQILLDSMAISRKHAVIVTTHGKYRIEDLESRGGTHVNGLRCIGPTELNDQHLIRIGNVRMQFYVIQS